MKTEKYPWAAEVTGIVEIGCNAGTDKHGHAVTRQMLLPGACKSERREAMCDGIQARVLPK